ncbi:hypothetical protein HFP89_06610 [Wenzhouxiangella sp. XN79A]|uniref:hypothetical protein n=1 Tax=Wenzhouxiangella sp. XN79A TaxID=2724193 RepID=UPI00144AB860|nr:hypothetical protein [Wenzhouxiangella sp. XN79A]NKI34833.1 hypothetical protein [Wenzhouxiangella sp. XN79A]
MHIDKNGRKWNHAVHIGTRWPNSRPAAAIRPETAKSCESFNKRMGDKGAMSR